MGKITFLINRFIKEFETELKREKNSFKDTEAIPLITHRRKGKDNDICIRKKYKGKIHEKTIKEKEYDSVTGRFILHMQMKNDLSFERIGIKRLSAITEKILKKEYLKLCDFYRGRPKPSENPNYPEGLMHKTARGEMVRSKSEVIIANMLHANKIDYLYEHPIRIKGAYVYYYPDFVIPISIRGEVTYWEHCELSGSEKYNEHRIDKKRKFEQAGITEGKNLIVTYDTPEGIIDSQEIQDIIDRYFLP